MSDNNPVNAGRLCAVRCLVATESGGYSNLVFKQHSRNLEARDIRLASALYYGTLERLITLNDALNLFLKKGIMSLDPEVRAILHVGLYQISFMDGIPERAAINESVNLCRIAGKSSASSLVNAVLHKCSGIRLPKENEQNPSVKYSVCQELYDLLLRQYPDCTKEILMGMFEKSPSVIGTNTLKISSNELERKMAGEGVVLEKAPLPDTFYIKNGSYLGTDSFKEGLFCIQSLSSRQAVLALDPRPGENMLDICAAPGGKSVLASMLMNNMGRIDSVDIHVHRVKLIEQNTKKYGSEIINPVISDALEFKSDIIYDRVLCDVPCGGYGEIASKPELRYKAPGKDDDGLFTLQYSLLEKGLSLLKVGGRIVYSTCSLDRRENDYLTAKFIKNHSGIRQIEECSFTILPGPSGSEGFYIATFERL